MKTAGLARCSVRCIVLNVCMFALAGLLSNPEDKGAHAIATICVLVGMAALVAGVSMEIIGVPMAEFLIAFGDIASMGAVAFGIASGQM